MARCMICGDGSSFDYECDYCEGTFCNKHHLPERHNCVHLRGAKTLGPEFRHLDNADKGSTDISETAREAKNVDRREERDTTECEGCGEVIDASRTYCPPCRLDLANLDEADGPQVVMGDSPEPGSLADRSRTISTENESKSLRDRLPDLNRVWSSDSDESMEDDDQEKVYCENCSTMVDPDQQFCEDCQKVFEYLEEKYDTDDSSKSHGDPRDHEYDTVSLSTTVGSTKEPDVDSGPDVAPDGSIKRSDDSESDEGGLVSRILSLFR